MVRTGCLAGLLLLAACSDDPLRGLITGGAGAGGKDTGRGTAGHPISSVGGSVGAGGGQPGFAGSPPSFGGMLFGTGGVPGAGGSSVDSGPGICGGVLFGLNRTPIDMLLMVDQSSSMQDAVAGNASATWWKATQSAVTAFVQQAEASAAGLAAGIQFFPLGGIAPQSCQANYEAPNVEIGLLPDNASAIAASIAEHQPNGFTPTAPALAGAIAHMKKWAPAHPGRVPVVVFVTDGFPTECEPQGISDIAQIVKQGFDTEPRVRTFVVGLNLGTAGASLKELSVAGGSVEPILINNGGDIVNQFVDAMLGLTQTALGCSFGIPMGPDGSTFDPAHVNVLISPKATTITQTVPMVETQANCARSGGSGWYYDPTTNQQTIELCPATCASLATARVGLLLGCAGPVIPPL